MSVGVMKRLKTKAEGSTSLTLKDIDEVNRREVCECDVRVCDLEAIGATSIFNVIRSAAALARMLPTLEQLSVYFYPSRYKEYDICGVSMRASCATSLTVLWACGWVSVEQS
jgi:hypothetical protein